MENTPPPMPHYPGCAAKAGGRGWLRKKAEGAALAPPRAVLVGGPPEGLWLRSRVPAPASGAGSRVARLKVCGSAPCCPPVPLGRGGRRWWVAPLPVLKMGGGQAPPAQSASPPGGDEVCFWFWSVSGPRQAPQAGSCRADKSLLARRWVVSCAPLVVGGARSWCPPERGCAVLWGLLSGSAVREGAKAPPRPPRK